MDGDRALRWLSFGDYGSGPGQLSDPRQVAVDGAGFVYVADSANNRVQRFTPDGQFAGSIGQGQTFTTRPDLLSTPRGVAVAPDGTIYASDEYLRRVQHYTPDGAFLGSFGTQGSGDGQFEATGAVAAGTDGSLYVADWSLSSIQRFSGGAFLGRVGSGVGSGPGQFSHPFYVAINCAGPCTSPTSTTTASSVWAIPPRRRAAIRPTIPPSGWW